MQPSSEDQGAGASSLVSSTSTELPSVRFVWGLRLLCSIALGITVYLAWTAFRMGEVFGCSGGEVFDCGHVLTSHWSKVAGVPVSVPAAGLYASLLALLMFARRNGPLQFRQMVWGGMTLGGVMAGLSALWFIGLQIFVVEHLCTYCLVVHSCGILLAGIVLTSRLCPFSLKLKSAAVSVLGVSVLVGIQAATPKADQFEIIRYPDAAPSAAIAVKGNGADALAAPVDVFEAPVDVFEAPVADDASSEAIEKENPTARSEDGSSETKPSETKPPVATTLLLIVPPRILRMTELLCVAVLDSGEDTGTADNTEKLSGDNKQQESTEPAGETTNDSTGNQAPAGDTTAAKESAESGQPAESAPKVPERRLLTFAGNRFTLDVRQWPLLGKPDAKYVFVEMFDYTCPHCRNTHHAIVGAQNQYGDDLAILALPVPLDAGCNPTVKVTGGGHAEACELARIAIAVWRLDPSKFREFHNWMFAGTRSAAMARQHAETLVDRDRLKKELGSSVPSQYISRHVSLYQKVGAGQVPKLIFPAATLNGEVNSTTSLCNTIERELSAVKQ